MWGKTLKKYNVKKSKAGDQGKRRHKMDKRNLSQQEIGEAREKPRYIPEK